MSNEIDFKNEELHKLHKFIIFVIISIFTIVIVLSKNESNLIK